MIVNRSYSIKQLAVIFTIQNMCKRKEIYQLYRMQQNNLEGRLPKKQKQKKKHNKGDYTIFNLL